MGLIVVEPGLSTTIQDGGRPGYREWGVPPGGVFDRRSAGLANALLGNPPDCAVLEMTLTGGTYKADGPLALALAGAPMESAMRARDGRTEVLQSPVSLSIRDGEHLLLGRLRDGARAYLAVKGGWLTPSRLGSRSSEERLQAGDVLPASPASIPRRHLSEPAWQHPTDGPIRVVPGPDYRLTSPFEDTFGPARRFRVGSNSNRMGLRLEGDAIAVAADSERLSTPVGAGALQIAGGQLIVLGVACGTMGGYPHIAQVIAADLDRIGQLRSGEHVEFRCVTIDEARKLHKERLAEERALFARLELLAHDA
jgi:5-oxoprolinase (ATP-hydrolysing) subunit C